MLGERIGNYRIIRELGSGAMGTVYLAEHEAIHTRIAVKVLHPHISKEENQVERFFNEARAVNQVRHAGIVKIHDVGFTEDRRAYLLMEMLEGESLAARLERGRLTHAALCENARQIASVLAATHEAGIVHRDLKPDNIFLARDQELPAGERVKILDFGIAKLTGMLAPRRATLSQSTMGTPLYMAPEQAGDASKVDGRADIYSLGCIVFEMACGRRPFEASSILEAIEQHARATPPVVRSIVADVPRALEALVARMLAKAPRDRPQTMQELVAEFAALAATPPDRRRSVWPWVLSAAGGTLVTVALASRGCGGAHAPGRLDAGEDAGSNALLDAAADRDAAAADGLRQRVETSDPFVEIPGAGLATMLRKVSREEYDWFLAALEAPRAAAMRPLRAWDAAVTPSQPVTWVAFEQARAFCQEIGADLPTDPEWLALAPSRTDEDATSSHREWTRTRFDDEMVLVRKSKPTEPTIQKTTNPSGSDGERAGPLLGFRCVRPVP